MLKPVIVVTVFRRYYELTQNLRALQALRHVFAVPPDVVLVWAQPEVGRLWTIQQLQSDGLIDHVIGRPALPEPERAARTSYPESHNLRLGLDYVFDHYRDCYALCMAADIRPAEWGLRRVDQDMQEGAAAAVYHWPNPIVPVGCWHTNFFAVAGDRQFWPPVSSHDHADVLEWQWGKQAQHLGIAHRYVVRPNCSDRAFCHAHESEEQPLWPVVPQEHAHAARLCLTGYKPWHRRLAEWVRQIIFRRPPV